MVRAFSGARCFRESGTHMGAWMDWAKAAIVLHAECGRLPSSAPEEA